jgi:transposase
MNIHKNARLTPHGRGRLVLLVRDGASRKAVAEQLGISVRTVAKWTPARTSPVSL